MDTADRHFDVCSMDMIIPPNETTTKRKTVNLAWFKVLGSQFTVEGQTDSWLLTLNPEP